MRLTKFEVNAIINAITYVTKEIKINIYLYGSRLNDNLKGGDIDLLVEVDSTNDYDFLSLEKYTMLAKIKQEKAIGDQKVDLSIVQSCKLKTDPFFSTIEKILLKTF
ncbi:MAG: nucleotidyltransferase domain-containing protein [Oligoflexia bacterium]|nr:nucleotidyltransferase domain-containing protein [Oligoflexia bacterium]